MTQPFSRFALSFLTFLAVLASAGSVQALNATPVIDLSGPGLAIAEGGVGLGGDPAGHLLPNTLNVSIPGPVRSAVLVWAGFVNDLGGPIGDSQLVFGGTPITGTLRGTENIIDPPFETRAFSYSADVTAIVQAAFSGPGPYMFSIADGNLADDAPRLHGAGLLVVYDDGSTDTFAVRAFVGTDYVFNRFAGPAGMTMPVTFSYPPAAAPRSADLVIFAGAAEEGRLGRTSRTAISDNAALFDLYSSADGRQWDTPVIPIQVPAGVGATTVQIFSEGANPDSLIWALAALRIPVAECLDVQKFCRVLPVEGNDCQGGVVFATFQYTGLGCAGSMNSQPTPLKAECTGSVGTPPLDVVVTSSKGVTASPTSVNVGDTFLLSSPAGRLGAEIAVELRSGGATEKNRIHTSCSQPLNVGDSFGSLKLVSLTSRRGGTVSDMQPGPGDLSSECRIAGNPSKKKTTKKSSDSTKKKSDSTKKKSDSTKKSSDSTKKKKANGDLAHVEYVYKVTNTGGSPVMFISVEDDKLGPIAGSPISSLAPGEMKVLSARAEIDETVTNTVEVEGDLDLESGAMCRDSASAVVKVGDGDDDDSDSDSHSTTKKVKTTKVKTTKVKTTKVKTKTPKH